MLYRCVSGVQYNCSVSMQVLLSIPLDEACPLSECLLLTITDLWQATGTTGFIPSATGAQPRPCVSFTYALSGAIARARSLPAPSPIPISIPRVLSKALPLYQALPFS